MSLSARTPTTAGTNLFVPAIYSKRIIDALKDNLVCWDAIDTSWKKGLALGNILYIPKTNTVAATEVTVGSKASALNPLNTTGVTLTINEWWEAPVDFDTMTLKQTQGDLESIAVDETTYAISKKMDSTVAALFSSLGGYSTSAYGSDGQTLTDDILLYLKETLDEADVPDSDRSLIIDPSALVDMLKIDKFIAAQYAAATDATKNGKIGKTPIYNCQVRVTNNLTATTTGAYAVMLHKRAIAGAAQIEKSWREEYKELHQIRFQAEALWGVIEANDTLGIPFYTRKK